MSLVHTFNIMPASNFDNIYFSLYTLNMYEILAQQYSQLFPSDRDRSSFVFNEIKAPAGKPPLVLDAGCATGDLAFELFDNGIAVTGIDLNSDMIEIAKKRVSDIAETSNRVDMPSLPVFYTKSMTEIAGLGNFNAVTCFGNTLPHLPDFGVTLDFFKQSASVLNPVGRLFFQLINFSKIEDRDSFNFPDIETEQSLFKRSYHRRFDGRLDFTISLTDLKTGEMESDSTPLLPLTKEKLTEQLGQAGFKNISIYSDWKKTPADGTEFATIYSASLISDC